MSVNKEEVLNKLHENVCQVVFTKVNGEERVMKCTLQESLLPPQKEEQKKKPNPDVVAVWDVEAEGWRSFRWDSVKSYMETNL